VPRAPIQSQHPEFGSTFILRLMRAGKLQKCIRLDTKSFFLLGTAFMLVERLFAKKISCCKPLVLQHISDVSQIT
jgi:hypothetical protein